MHTENRCIGTKGVCLQCIESYDILNSCQSFIKTKRSRFNKSENILRCIVHYDFFKTSSQALLLHESALKTLLENKAARKMKRTKILNFILLVPDITEKTLERSERGGSERNTLSKLIEFFKSNITECGKVCLMDALTEIFSQESTDRKQ